VCDHLARFPVRCRRGPVALGAAGVDLREAEPRVLLPHVVQQAAGHVPVPGILHAPRPEGLAGEEAILGEGNEGKKPIKNVGLVNTTMGTGALKKEPTQEHKNVLFFAFCF